MTKLIIVNGVPASGKTRLTDQLSKELSLPAFSKDDFKELLADTIGFTDFDSTLRFGKASFVILFSTAKRLLDNGVSLIIEANFSPGEETDEFLSYLRQSDVAVYEILCHADGQVLVDRFKARKRHPVHHVLDDAALERYMDMHVRKGKCESLQVGTLLEVDTTEIEKIPYEQILAFVSAR